jgi:hypothetical protein
MLACLMLWFISVESTVRSESKGSVLYRSLIGRNETVRFRALQHLQVDPKTRRGSLNDMIEAAQFHVRETEADDLARPSTVALINLIAETETPETESLLISLLDAPHHGIAMISAEALGRHKYFGAIEALKRQTGRREYREKYAFRFNLVRALAQMEHPDAIEFLAELQSTLDGQLRHHVQTVVDGVTIDHFRGDSERFEQFRKPEVKNAASSMSPDDRIFKAAKFEPESLQRMRLKPQQYYGIDIHARRLMFIIDHSSSMKDYWGGMTRLDRAKYELTRAITELPGEAEFAIVFYHTSVRFWRNELVPATEENKREAIEFVRRLGYGDKTNTYGALKFSLEFDDQLESVFLLTDGKPTFGEIRDKAVIVKDILHRNRFRHLNFNTIGIAVDGATRAFLQQLATESNGEFRDAR